MASSPKRRWRRERPPGSDGPSLFRSSTLMSSTCLAGSKLADIVPRSWGILFAFRREAALLPRNTAVSSFGSSSKSPSCCLEPSARQTGLNSERPADDRSPWGGDGRRDGAGRRLPCCRQQRGFDCPPWPAPRAPPPEPLVIARSRP